MLHSVCSTCCRLTSGWLFTVHACVHVPVCALQGFASGSERFTPASAPIASPDYASFDGSSMRGDQTQLGPGAYLKLVSAGVTSGWWQGRSGKLGSSSKAGTNTLTGSPVSAAAACCALLT